MLQIKWNKGYDFSNEDSLETLIFKFKRMKQWLEKLEPDYASLDTETDGLHIKNCKPFLISFGFVNSTTKEGITYTIETECNRFGLLMHHIYELMGKVKKLVFYNVKFDLHMLCNIDQPYPYKNVTDAQIYCRLSSDALSKSEGGIPVKLKDFAARYITLDAKNFERKLADERKRKKSQNTAALKQKLLTFGEPPAEFRVGNEKSWTMKTINEFFQDKIHSVDDLPNGVREVVKDWQSKYEDPDNYKYLTRSVVKEYAHLDIVYTLEAFLMTKPIVYARNQQKTLEIEENAIIPLFKMERVGFKFNLEYALECKEKLKNYIKKRRQDLYEIAGSKLKTSQHAKVKQLIQSLGYDITSTQKQKLHHELAEIAGSNAETVKEFVATLEELRTLEKWYSTYIIKWIDSLGNDGRVYTQFNQTGAVSGRLSSDFQQFPSKPILDNEGNVLFHPRRMIQVTGEGYDSIVYIDFAAEELRFQALYTMLVSGGDLNFCRAFIPLNCHTAEGLKYTPDMAYTWFDKTWYLDENNEPWHSVDLHAQTAMSAFPNEPTNTDYFKNTLRKKYGKPTNFACVYGASIGTLINQFYFEPEMATALHTGFYKAYPKIKDYAVWVNNQLLRNGYAENLFGRRYYNTSGHKARNYLIQGSCADYLKIKLKEIDDYLVAGNYKSRMQMNIHDECSFEIYKGEEHIIKDLQAIMQQLDGSLIPILADLEITYTTWDEKVDLEL
jgi:DNA polymerase I-like protein with 3'-5' exonuclease and polymerase domains